MADDKPTLDTVIAQVETVLRLRSAVKIAHETIVRTTRELGVHREELAKHEAALTDAIGVKSSTTIENFVETRGWARQRERLDKPKKGDIVWTGNRKELGIFQKGGFVKNSAGKNYRCSTRNIFKPFPHESFVMQDKR